jgi:DNA-binding winged helix-turn-helix (wHTH) protein/tetratricopeptide (TPR) repeat protein
MDEERLRFGDFELRPDSGELLRRGTPVKIQPQPAKVLELLARRSGEVVSREDFRRHLWGEETFVDFEHGLNFSIRQIRRALGDSAEAPRFVETVPRHGYRFLLPVIVETAPPAPEAAAPAPPLQARWRWMLGTAAAAVLLLVLGLVEAERSPGPVRARPPGVSREAWIAYLEGRRFTRREADPEEREKGIAAFQRATLLAPRFADAYAGLARAEVTQGPAQDTFPVAEAAARRAVELDPRQAEAHWVLAQTALFYDHDLARAGQESALALRSDPKLAEAHLIRAHYLAIVGRHTEAIAEAERTRDLDPEGKVTEPDLLCYHYFLARRYGDAVACGKHIAEISTDHYDVYWARIWTFWAAWLGGDPETAVHVTKAHFRNVSPAPERPVMARDFWQWDLDRFDKLRKKDPQQPAAYAVPDLLALGERDRALDLLEQAEGEHDTWALAFLGVDPRYDSLRGDPRFEKLLQRLHLREINPSPRPAV